MILRKQILVPEVSMGIPQFLHTQRQQPCTWGMAPCDKLLYESL